MQPSYGNPYGPSGPMTRARPWVIAFTAFIVMLVIIVALGNPSVTDDLRRHAANARAFNQGLLDAAAGLYWHFGNGGIYAGGLGTASLLRALAVLVLVLLLVAVISRGHGRFWQLFLGTWVCVAIAVLLASYVFSATVNRGLLFGQGLNGDPAASRGTFIVFGELTAGATTLFTGLGAGLVTALITATVGVLTRLPDGPGGYPPPESGQPYYEQPVDPAAEADGWQAPPRETQRAPWQAPSREPEPGGWQAPQPDIQHTARLPMVGQQPDDAPDDPNATREFPSR